MRLGPVVSIACISLMAAIAGGYIGAALRDHHPLNNLGPEMSIASASTTDLGTLSSAVVLVTGTTGITSFGSSASATYPIYYVRYQGVVSLANSAHMILLGGKNRTTT